MLVNEWSELEIISICKVLNYSDLNLIEVQNLDTLDGWLKLKFDKLKRKCLRI